MSTAGASHPDSGQRPPEYWQQACRDLSKADPVMRSLIGRHPEVLSGSGNAFRTALNAIVGQQISVAAADGIWGRLVAALPAITPEAVVALDAATLREIGLSNRKVEYAHGLAGAFLRGELNPRRWPQMNDEQIRSELTALRGIGPWTADMVLIFHERRPDVLPLGDIGLINAAARLYGWDGDDADVGTKREQLAAHAERWRPWRTVATWFVWRELDVEPVVY